MFNKPHLLTKKQNIMQKFLRTLAIVAAMLLPFAMQAQNSWTVADGTTTHAKVPLDFYNCDGSGNRQAQMLYPASLLTDMNGSTIGSITFYHQNTSANKTLSSSTWYIRMGETTATDLSEGLSTETLTTVYSGNLVVAGGVFSFEFSTPYTYNGGNLIVEIQTSGASGNYFGTSNQGCYGVDNAGSTYSTMSTPNYTAFLPKTTFTEVPSCFTVTNLAIDAQATTTNSLTLTWTDSRNTSATYSIYDMSDSSVVATGISGTTYTATGLTANTTYTFGVMADCGGGDVTDMVSVSGRTACAAISTLPYTCGFEENEIAGTASASAFPYCWTRINTLTSGTYTYYPYSSTSGANTGTRKLYFYASSYGTYADTTGFVMPELDVNTYPMNGNRLTFWAKVTSTTPYTLLVGTMSDPTDRSTFTLIETVTVSGTTYTKYTVSLANATATDAYVAVMVPKVTATMYIDDVTLEEMPSCLEVPTATVEAVTSSSITLSWVANEGNASATYTIYNMADTSEVAFNINDTTYTVDNLDANTAYTFAIQANCPSGDAPLTTVSGRTACAAEALPFTETFDATLSSNLCWRGASVLYTDSVNVTMGTASNWTYCSSVSNGLEAGHYRVNIYGTSCYKWMITPEIDLGEATNPLLTFDAAFTVYTSSSTGPATGFESNDSQKFMVLVSTNNGQTWSVASDITLSSIASATYIPQYVNLAEYAGETVRIAFYAQSTVNGGDNNLHIDNIAINESTGEICYPVSGLVASEITSEGATLTWSGDATSYNVYAIATDTTLVQNVSDTTIIFTNLDANTAYTYGVTAVCSNDESPMVSVTFRTACGAFAAPYTWDFEDMNTSAVATCWTKLGGGSANVTSGTGDAYYHSATKYIQFSGVAGNNMLVLPATEDEISALQLRFWTRPESFTSSSCGTFSVGYVTDITDATTFVAAATYTYSDFSAYEEKTVTFAGAPAGARMAMRHDANASYYYWYVDDVTIEDAPNCLPVSGLAASAITADGATLTWTGDASSYNVYAIATDTTFVQNVTDATIDLTNLTANTQYTYGVRSACGSEESDMVSVTFRTACAAEALPFSETFDATLSTDPCWAGANVLYTDGVNVTMGACTNWTYASSVSNGLEAGHYRVNIYGTTCYKWMITPEIDLSEATNPLLTFDAAFTKYSGTAVADGDITDDKFMILATTNNGQTWSVASNIALSGLASTTYLRQYVSLANYAGETVRLAFYAESTVSGGDNNLHIDNISVDESTGDICYPVSNLAVNNITTDGATLSWDGDATSYNVYTIAGTDTTFVQNVTDTFMVLNNLTAMTSYTYGVRAVCGNDESDMMTVSFTTACAAIAIPYTENFEDNSITFNCWTVDGVSSTGLYNGAFRFYYSDNPPQYLVSPELSGITDGVNVSFLYKAYNTSYPESFQLGYSTTTNAYADFTWLAEVTNITNTEYTEYSQELPGAVKYVAIKYTADDQFYLFIDSLSITAPVPPAPVVPEATIAASDIVYWVGNGNNEVVMAVNWPDTALAWGYRFSTDSVTVATMMADIMTADPRFSYTYTVDGYLSDIVFAENGTTLQGNANGYWEEKLNGVYGMGLTNAISNGDFVKWGNSAAGVVVDSFYYEGWGWSYIYNYPMTIYPVSVPTVGPVLDSCIMTLPFVEDFSATSTSRDCWTTIDADNDGFGWTTFYGTTDMEEMLSASYDDEEQEALTPDNWLISPKIHTVAGNTITMQWDIAAADNSYYAEHYGVYVSTTTTDTAAFTLLNEWTLTSAATTAMNIDLSAYAGQDIYVAFRHFNCTDMYFLMLDNVNIHEGAYVPDTLTVVLATDNATMGTTNPVPGTYQYITGDTVIFSAVANNGYHFTQWEYTAAGDTTVYTYSNENVSFLASNMMSAGTLTFTANFAADPTCDAIAIPYVENFTADTALTCWKMVNCHASTGLYNGAFRFRYTTTPPQYLISPELTGTQNGIQLAFDYKAYSANYPESFMVGYSTTTKDTSAFTWSPEVTNITSTEYLRYVENVTTSGVKYVAIKYTANDQYYLYIDSLVVREIPSCPAVTGLTVDSATATSVFLSWNGTANSYTVYNMDNNTVIASNVAGNTYEVTGLTASTDYVFGVVANCGTETSEITTVAARTDCANGGCNITITSTGSYGFLGASIDVMQNGVLVSSVSGNDVVYVCSDAPVSLVYNSSALGYDSYVSFTVADGAGTVVYTCTAANSLTDGAVFTTIATPCPTCMPVSNLTVSNATTTSITIGWTGNAASYAVYNGTTFVANVTANTYTFTGLTAATAYTFGVQAICSATDSSIIVTINAMTECDDITTLPYNEGFENGLGCWSSVNGSADGVDWNAQPAFSSGSVAPHTGNYMAASWSWNSSAMHANAWMISPKFVLPTVSAGDSLTFAWWARTNHGYPDSYSVVLSTSTNDTAAFTTVIRPYAMADTNDTWVLHTVDLTAYAGQSIYIAFHHVDYDMNYLLIDDISLFQGAYVPPARDSIVVTYTTNNATLGTTDPAPGTYTYYAGDTIHFNAIETTGNTFLYWIVEYSNGSVDTLGAQYQSGYYTMASTMIGYGFTSMTFNAYFVSGTVAPDSIAVTYAVNDASMGSINPSGVVMTAVGDTVAATATANAGYELYGWQYTMYVGGQVYQDTTFVIDYTSVAFAIVNQSFVDYNVTITVTALFQPEVGIEDVDGSNVNIYSTDNKIIVKGAEGESIYIYDLSGRTIATKANASETMEFNMVSGGVYLVKVGDAPAKRVLVVR